MVFVKSAPLVYISLASVRVEIKLGWRTGGIPPNGSLIVDTSGYNQDLLRRQDAMSTLLLR